MNAHTPPAQGIRLNKRMADLGLCSRREADDWIERGWVRLDGEIAILGSKWLPGQKITVDERASKQQARWHTVLLHKPIGYVSGQAEDGHQPASVLVLPETQWKPPAGKAMHLGPAMALTLRKELLGEAAQFYRRFNDQSAGDDPAIGLQQASILRHLAGIASLMGDKREAENHLRTALARLLSGEPAEAGGRWIDETFKKATKEE